MVAKKFERRWRNRFQVYAELHEDDAGIAGWTPTGLEARVKRFRRVWPGATPGSLWLDAGCGAGTYVRLLSDYDVPVIGLDYSVGSLVKARQRTVGTIHWTVGDVTQLPLASASVDGILCFGVTQALEDPESAVRELSRVSKSEGQVWIDALNGWCLPHFVERLTRRLLGRAPHLRYQSPRHLKTLMRRAGLGRLRIHWLPIIPRRFYALQRVVEHPITVGLLRIVSPLGALFSHSFILYGERKAAGESR